MTNRNITDALEAACPLHLQESWDNSGWQCGTPSEPCSGVLLCVDVTEAILDEAKARGCNLVISHHPLLFKPTRSIINGEDRIGPCLMKAIGAGISIYSSHTSCDCAPEGVSHQVCCQLGLADIIPLDTATGLGAIGKLPQTLPLEGFLKLLKETLGTSVLRYSAPPSEDFQVTTVAVCGGAGADLLPLAAQSGADVLVTADCKHNTFLDVGRQPVVLIDAGHFETEICTKDIFYRAITEKFPNFAIWKSSVEENPVKYY